MGPKGRPSQPTRYATVMRCGRLLLKVGGDLPNLPSSGESHARKIMCILGHRAVKMARDKGFAATQTMMSPAFCRLRPDARSRKSLYIFWEPRRRRDGIRVAGPSG